MTIHPAIFAGVVLVTGIVCILAGLWMAGLLSNSPVARNSADPDGEINGEPSESPVLSGRGRKLSNPNNRN